MTICTRSLIWLSANWKLSWSKVWPVGKVLTQVAFASKREGEISVSLCQPASDVNQKELLEMNVITHKGAKASGVVGG